VDVHAGQEKQAYALADLWNDHTFVYCSFFKPDLLFVRSRHGSFRMGMTQHGMKQFEDYGPVLNILLVTPVVFYLASG
jgi:hypothetical protein